MRAWKILGCLTLTLAWMGAACDSGGGGTADPQGGNSGEASGGSSAGGSKAAGGSSSGGMTSSGGRSSSGGSANSGGSTGAGGSTTNGGSAANAGGTTSTGNGGTTNAGGTASAGGASAKGGATGAGGTASAGGSSAKGGTTGSGGAAAGGAAASGGTTGSGGTTSTSTAAKFSFFVVSYAALQKIAGTTKGLGGDLRHGQTGTGAGLRGADKICSEVAEGSLAGSGSKTWRAFLSATTDENGKQVNAIERIGSGPWYDRLGRLFANNLDELYYDRPQNAAAAIKNDFPNETGTNNQNPDKTGNVDNHDMITGSSNQGKLYGATATCSDWTSVSTTGSKPRVGHSWPTSTTGCSTTSTKGTTGTGTGGGMGMGGMCNWMSALDEAGCAPGVNLIQNGGPGNDGTVGSGGGYGGFYCFALTP